MPQSFLKSRPETKEKKPRRRDKQSRAISPTEVKYLCQQEKLSAVQMAALLHCHPKTLWNLQAGDKPRAISNMMDAFLTLLLYPPIRAMVDDAKAYRKKLLAKERNLFNTP